MTTCFGIRDFLGGLGAGSAVVAAMADPFTNDADPVAVGKGGAPASSNAVAEISSEFNAER